MSEISTLYNDVKITYEEKRDVWTFSLRGRERSADSLEKAKEAIDRVPKEKKNAFDRVAVWCAESRWNSSNWVKGEITSIAESGYSNPEVWLSANGDRRKVYATSVFPVGEHNDALIAEMNSLDVQIKALNAKRDVAQKKLQAYVVPKDDTL